ncbi:helix-turn-helix domain-containing protein [Merdimmobilis hominis]|jgi:transcriptional regulator with XRE-family HTH domain|uniref:helix-turn-helix domain-containing protein n=1 Tax=Merdimmobilis hominis TaxID=2897707 RepID=UPI0006C81FBB|nr:helix-turn-helix transcriptional regulator [Merdimmobilis hominis]MCD4835424.1 helix-turn-helix transcriptional regulator [Merdimmobilis hominis]PWL60903.1 MAG: XRE family transcriptional regulator [Oscillospiraceae bacterium]
MAKKVGDPEIISSLSSRVRSLREGMGISRADLAKAVGVTDFTIMEIEKGRRGVSVTTLRDLAKALGTTTDYLLSERDPLSDVREVTALLAALEPVYQKDVLTSVKAQIHSIRTAEKRAPQDETDQ